MTRNELILRLLHERTAQRLAMPREELRTILLKEQQEIIDGWLGVSDWLLSMPKFALGGTVQREE